MNFLRQYDPFRTIVEFFILLSLLFCVRFVSDWLSVVLVFSLNFPIAYLIWLSLPRIIVTIKSEKGIKEIRCVADGRKVYLNSEADSSNDLLIQFSFQVWEKGIYDVHVMFKDENCDWIEPLSRKVNLYEHNVASISFSIEDGKNGKN